VKERAGETPAVQEGQAGSLPAAGRPALRHGTMKSKGRRVRLDVLLVERGLADTQKSAQAMILAGGVRVEGVAAPKPGEQVLNDAQIEVSERQRFSSRGGRKLEGALEDFAIDPTRRVCLDIGSSTGGFTDCLLQRGAAKVFAVDVTISQLDWKLRNDPRVMAFEKNARELEVADLPELAELVVADVSFISLTKILAAAAACATANADFLLLIKPQFELPREDVGPGGIVSDAQLHEKAVARVKKAAEAAGLACLNVRPSRVKGSEGNQEYFLHARKGT
jgi:23S rRNA (cytidine1920-2'-O)/16S rRNA (cytidine1409-2'-O)-methyltransferase